MINNVQLTLTEHYYHDPNIVQSILFVLNNVFFLLAMKQRPQKKWFLSQGLLKYYD